MPETNGGGRDPFITVCGENRFTWVGCDGFNNPLDLLTHLRADFAQTYRCSSRFGMKDS